MLELLDLHRHVVACHEGHTSIAGIDAGEIRTSIVRSFGVGCVRFLEAEILDVSRSYVLISVSSHGPNIFHNYICTCFGGPR